MSSKEVRDLMTGLELREAPEGSDSPGTMVGYASVFGPLSQDLGGFKERIEPGAFRDAILRCDVRCLANHDTGKLLGRCRPNKPGGTLRMREDELGLRVENDLPNTHVGRDTAEEVRRGDMDGMSFSFTVAPGDDEWEMADGLWIRTVKRIDQLYDVGPVTFPAYTDTRVAVRSLESARGRAAGPQRLNVVKARLKLAESSL